MTTEHPNRQDHILLNDVTEAIGNTPLVNLSRLVKHYGIEDGGRILAKLEYLNPGFSKKDRIAKRILLDAVESGELRDGQTVVELTSGNTGTGLAIVCSVMKFPFVAVMSRGNSVERARMMKALGAEVVLVDQAPGSAPGQVTGEDLALVERRTRQIAEERGAFRADQFRSQSNADAHFLTTGPEMWKASGGAITAFCDFVGTGGSFGGISSYLKSKNPRVKCYVVEPAGAAVLSCGAAAASRPNHRIQGGGYVMEDLPMLRYSGRPRATPADAGEGGGAVSDCCSGNGGGGGSSSSNGERPPMVDGYLQVSDEQAIHVARDLARYEGILGGFSAGANVAAAIELLTTREEHRGGAVAVLVCDSGLKYLSTDLWGDA